MANHVEFPYEGMENFWRSRGNCDIGNPFCFIWISQSVAEIRGLKVCAAFKGLRMGPRPTFFPGIVLATSFLEFGYDVFPGIAVCRLSVIWDRSVRQVRARGPSKR